MIKKLFCTAVFIWLACSLTAQVLIQFEPAINGQTLDGLSYVRLINSSAGTVDGALKITVKDQSGRTAVMVQTPAFSLMPGNNSLNRAIYTRSNVTFGNSLAGNAVSRTSRFPEGEYEYCYEFIENPKASNPQTYFNCFQYALQPLTPLLLVDPFDRSTICNIRPDLIWTPPMPVQPGMKYRVLLVEVKNKQVPAEALSTNVPIIFSGNIVNNILSFPAQSPSLTEGKTYAWQVVAYNEKTAVIQSEIWSFAVKCNERKADSTAFSYAELKTEASGNFYLADRIVRFSFNNPYGDGILEYDIRNLSDPSRKIKKLPAIKMRSGLNVIDLDLGTHPAFKNGGQYILTISNVENHELQMRFLFKK
jgi:hypothetical protein